MYTFVKDLIDMNKPAGHGASFSSTANQFTRRSQILRKDLGL